MTATAQPSNDFDHVDFALGLILDNSKLAQYMNKRAHEILGREPKHDLDEDDEWWGARTQALNELLDQMRVRNNSGLLN